MSPDDRVPPPDLLQHAVIIVLILAGGLALALGALHTGIGGLSELATCLTCWGLAAHLVKVGRLY